MGACIISGESVGPHIERACKGLATTYFCDSVDSLLTQMQCCECPLVIIADNGQEGFTQLSNIHSARPDAYILLWLATGQRFAVDSRALVGAGVHRLVVGDDRLLRDEIGRFILRAASTRAISKTVFQMLPVCCIEAVSSLAFCMSSQLRSPSVAGLAKEFDVDRTTLLAFFNYAGLPTPGETLVWTRLLVAAQLLEDTGIPVDSIAKLLGFASPVAFRNVFKRHMKVRASEVRLKHPMDFVLRQFLCRLKHCSGEAVGVRSTRRFSELRRRLLGSAKHGTLTSSDWCRNAGTRDLRN